MISDQALTIFLAVVVLIIVGISSAFYVVFMRFMKKEKEKGERFREIHRRPKDT